MLAGSAGMTVPLAEQNAFAALKIAHRAYVIEGGRIVLEGNRASLLGNDAVRRAYVGDSRGSSGGSKHWR